RGAAPRAGPRERRRVQAVSTATRRGGGRLEPQGPRREADARARGAAGRERGAAPPLREALRGLPLHRGLTAGGGPTEQSATPGRRADGPDCAVEYGRSGGTAGPRAAARGRHSSA